MLGKLCWWKMLESQTPTTDAPAEIHPKVEQPERAFKTSVLMLG
jgi:hypothetical protein